MQAHLLLSDMQSAQSVIILVVEWQKGVGILNVFIVLN